MILVNLHGGPGVGKSTIAADLFVRLKREGIHAELVGEAAKDIVFDNALDYFNNQVLITGLQYQRILRLKNYGCKVAISDCPLILGAIYGEKFPYAEELKNLILKLEKEFEPFNVLVERHHKYNSFGRMQTEEAAIEIDDKIQKLVKQFHYKIYSTRLDVDTLLHRIKYILTFGT